jgi:hypothetical protein
MKHGNSNLGDTAKKCEQGRAPSTTTAEAVPMYVVFLSRFPPHSLSICSPYNEARHRAICAIRCAANKRPFASQDDRWYRAEVELLRPGTIPPSSKTVERDLGILYSEFAKVVRWYFEVLLQSLSCLLKIHFA